jgi:hypothetical protein
MTDAELVSALERLGVEPEDPRAVLLLPLVEVAWADGRIQEPERLRILEIARGYGVVGGRSEGTLRAWLSTPPTPELAALGHDVVVALARRHRGPSADWDPDTLDRLEEQCLDVARAAGGLFGIVFATSAEESRALSAIRGALRARRDAHDDGLPEPDGGVFEDV